MPASRYSQPWDDYRGLAATPPPRRDRGAESRADLLRLLGGAAAPVGTVLGGLAGGAIGALGGPAGIMGGAAAGAGLGGAIGGGLGGLANAGADMQTRPQDEAELERAARRQLLMQVLGGRR